LLPINTFPSPPTIHFLAFPWVLLYQKRA